MSSASRPSASVVKPTRSAKRIVTSRRSATGAELVGPGRTVVAGEDVAPATRGFAHSPQNFAVGRLAVPQAGHTCVSRAAHSMQNLVPAGFSVPQLEQTNWRPPRDLRRRAYSTTTGRR